MIKPTSTSPEKDSYETNESVLFTKITRELNTLKVNKKQQLHNTPPVGLEQFNTLYAQKGNVDTLMVIREVNAILYSEQSTFQVSTASSPNEKIGKVTGCNPNPQHQDLMILALIERLRLFQCNEMLPSESIDKLKQLIGCLGQISQDMIPDEFRLEFPLVTLLSLKWSPLPDVPHGSTLDGPIEFGEFYLNVIYFLKNCLGLHQIFSKRFAQELLNCLKDFPNTRLEIASGRAQLSASFRSVSSKFIVASDKSVPTATFDNFPVRKFDALKLIRAYGGEKPIYFTSEPTLELMDSLCAEALKQQEPIIVVTIGALLKSVLSKYKRNLVVLELNIPDYLQLKDNAGVQLLFFNHNKDQLKSCKEKLPRRYLRFPSQAEYC
ncbi:hypothetical protein D5018_20235 [Parashewanella curva]|uniref:Uncharacterized protein n=1 Tax=Parashewanella curva TaxID=2338552 RepID=A0A3L8PTZ5_9GAMM|nr:hypothetical protein [Parashewanella curva]RLV57878.1 hypothetical protein D5018_20235 [Parashewanella curva]